MPQRICYPFFSFLILCLSLSASLFAQEIVSFDVTPEETTLGAVVKYEATIEFTEEVSLSEPEWGQMTWAEFESVENGKPVDPDLFQKIWHISKIFYVLEEGQHQIPSFELLAKSRTGKEFSAKLPQKQLTVKTLWSQQEPPQLKPFKVIPIIEDSSQKLWLTGGAIGLVILLIAVFVFWKNRQKSSNTEPVRSARDILLQSLNALQVEDTQQPLEHSQYAARLYGVVKQALAVKTASQVESMTQQEIKELLPRFFDQEQIQRVSKILNFLESIQYARIDLSLSEKDQMTQQTAEWIRLCTQPSDDNINAPQTL